MSLRFASLNDLGKGAWRVSGASPFNPESMPSPVASKKPTPPASTPPQSASPAHSKPHRKPRKNEVEGEEQAILIKEFRLRYPRHGELLVHIPNGGSRKNAFEGWRLKEQGVRAGVSDLFLPMARGGFFGLWIEFKAAPPFNAPVSDAQIEWLEEMREQGYRAEICLGVNAAMEVLDSYMAMAPALR